MVFSQNMNLISANYTQAILICEIQSLFWEHSAIEVYVYSSYIKIPLVDISIYFDLINWLFVRLLP